MDKKTDSPSEQPPAQDKDGEFAKRHAEELGVKRFAKVQAAYTFIPILAAAAGAALGYYALARPVAKLFPKITKTAGVAEVATKKIAGSAKKLLSGHSIGEVFKEYNPTQEQLKELGKVWNDKDVFHSDKLKKFVEILNPTLPEVPETVRVGTALGGFVVGSTAGGVAIGYDKWRKDESARLSAQEINHDVANLELFKPSDPELLAENKRLQAMVAALPTIDAATAQRQGVVEEKQQEASIR